MRVSIPLLAALAAALLAAPPASGQAEDQGDGKNDGRAADPPLPFTTADELLLALENADADLQRLSASISYTRDYFVSGDRQTRNGLLVFTADRSRPGAVPDRRFAIRFDQLIVGERVEDDPQLYIFDGQWLIEKYPSQKRFAKRQVVPPGQRFDPLRIGEGPMPIPIGQRREDILARYRPAMLAATDSLESTEGDPAAEALLALVSSKPTYQLRLEPVPERVDVDPFEEIRLWYRADTLLPCAARTVNAAGDVSIVFLTRVRRNELAEIDAALLDTKTPDGWDGHIVPWREPAPTDR